MHRINELSAGLPYRQFVFLFPLKPIEAWGVISVDGDFKEYLITKRLESCQPHEIHIGRMGGMKVQGLVYPGCRAILRGLEVRIVSIIEPDYTCDVMEITGGVDVQVD